VFSVFTKNLGTPRALFLLVGCLSVLTCVNAKNASDTLIIKKDLQEIHVNGKNKKQLRSAMPTQLLTTHEIEKLNAVNVADVAKHFAGVTIKDYGGIGGLKTISVRGLGAAHTGISYDGLLMSDIQSGQIDLSQFCVENISSVSLDNGQPMHLLQSARSFASSSVLALQTKLPEYDSARTFTGRLGIKAGSFGLINPTILLEKYFSPRWAVSFNSIGTKATGNYPYAININPYGENIVEGIRKNTDVSSLISEINSVYHIRAAEQLSFKVNNYYCDRGLPGSVTIYNDNDGTARMTDNNWLSQLYYENKNSYIWQYLISAKFNSQSMYFAEVSNNYASLPDKKRIEDYRQNEYYLSSTVQYRPVSSLTFAIALDGWYNNLMTMSNMNYKEDPRPTRQTVLANFSAKYVNERFTAGGNLLFTGTHETSDSTFAAPDRKKLSPTAYMSWQVNDNDNLILRAFYKEIFRLPTFTELYYHDLGYKYLLPETTQQFNVGVTYHTSDLPAISYFSVTADAYYNRISDKITIVYGMPFSSVRNIGIVGVKGCDINLSVNKNINKNSDLQLNANYTFQLAQDKQKNTDTYNDIIPYTPVHSGSASLTYRYKRFDAGYNMVFAGKRYSGQNVDIFNYLKPYVDQNIFAGYTLKSFKFQAELLNIANVNYAVIQYYPMPGRHYRLTVNYKF
jgi:outer membrane cobalamin receptor